MKTLEELKSVNGILVGPHDLKGSDITSLPEGTKIVEKDLFLQLSKINSLPETLKLVKGDLCLQGTDVDSLPEDLVVEGNLSIKNTKIPTLPKGLNVSKNIDATGTPLSLVSEGVMVGIDLDLRCTALGNDSFPYPIYVGGDVYLPIEDVKGSRLVTLHRDSYVDGKVKKKTYLHDH